MRTTEPTPSRIGWRSRGYLPHFDGGADVPQVVTFRLADSVPRAVVDQWLVELRYRTDEERERRVRELLDKYLDAGYGACHLRDSRIGALVENALTHFDCARYLLHAWVVMPNHVHALFAPCANYELADILGGWKSYTAKRANEILGRTGPFWQPEYYDRYVRDADHLDSAIRYIENNPVKAGLCMEQRDWPFGSARLRADARAAETAAVPGEKP